MAAVTVTKRRTNNAGSKKHKTFRISGDNNYTLNTRMNAIDAVAYDSALITAAAISGAPGALTLTFSASGAFSNIELLVIGG